MIPWGRIGRCQLLPFVIWLLQNADVNRLYQLQFPSGYVLLSHFADLLKADSCHGGLRAVPKLSVNHVEPNNLQRMNVRLAVQVKSACSYCCWFEWLASKVLAMALGLAKLLDHQLLNCGLTFQFWDLTTSLKKGKKNHALHVWGFSNMPKLMQSSFLVSICAAPGPFDGGVGGTPPTPCGYGPMRHNRLVYAFNSAILFITPHDLFCWKNNWPVFVISCSATRLLTA